jgi:hypothetical protein
VTAGLEVTPAPLWFCGRAQRRRDMELDRIEQFLGRLVDQNEDIYQALRDIFSELYKIKEELKSVSAELNSFSKGSFVERIIDKLEAIDDSLEVIDGSIQASSPDEP